MYTIYNIYTINCTEYSTECILFKSYCKYMAHPYYVHIIYFVLYSMCTLDIYLYTLYYIYIL